MRNIVILAFILLLAFCMAFIPHIGYAYPLHVDEWMHMTYAETIAQTGSITFPDPFTGQSYIKLGDNLWVGYHILWAMFQQVSGIDWIVLFRYFPPIIFMVIVLAVYVLAARWGYGLEAAFFTCLIPTTGGLLGPAFMVPMALGMLFIPLSMFLAFNIKKWPSYLLIFLFTCFLLISHATTAIVLCITLAPYILLNLKDNKRHGAGVLAALVLPFVLSLPWTSRIAVQTASQLFVPQHLSPYVQLPDLLWKYGIVPLFFSLLGTIIFLSKGGKRNLGLVLGLGSLLAIMLVFIKFGYGLPTVYDRGLTVMLLILSILAGGGLFWLRKFKLPAGFLKKHRSRLLRVLAPFASIFLTVVTLIVAFPTRLDAVFYHMIDDQDYQAFTWIKDNLGADYAKAVLDPWKATAFCAITGKQVMHRIWISQEPVDGVIYHFLEDGCTNTTLLTDNKLSFVYGLLPCNNPNLIGIKNGTYVSNPNTSTYFAQNANYVKNPGFEPAYGSPPTFWQTWMDSCSPVFRDKEPGRNGGWCVSITMTSSAPFTPWPQAAWGQDISVQEGKSYTIGGWLKTAAIEGQGGAMIMPGWQGPGAKWLGASEFMPLIQGSNGWTYYMGHVNAPEGATNCKVNCYMAGCSGTAWYDDIVFTPD